MPFEANQALFWSLYKHTSGQKEAKLPKTLFTGQVEHHIGFFFLMLTYSFQRSGMGKRPNIMIEFVEKCLTFLLSPCFLSFFCHCT